MIDRLHIVYAFPLKRFILLTNYQDITGDTLVVGQCLLRFVNSPIIHWMICDISPAL